MLAQLFWSLLWVQKGRGYATPLPYSFRTFPEEVLICHPGEGRFLPLIFMYFQFLLHFSDFLCFISFYLDCESGLVVFSVFADKGRPL